MGTTHRRQGFTMIEVLVSMGIIAVGVLALASARSKSINYTSIARGFVTATNLASAKIDQCAAMPKYLMMYCDKTKPRCGAGQNSLADSCCPVDPAALALCGTCAGTEMHVECTPDGTPDSTLTAQEAGYYNFRRRAVVSSKSTLPDGTVVDTSPMVRVAVDVCFPRPGMEAAPDLGDPAVCDYWRTSPCSICIRESIVRTTN